MSIKQFKPYTAARRHMSIQGREDITADKPERSLVVETIRAGLPCVISEADTEERTEL